MITSAFRSARAASPAMTAVSAGLHGLCLLVLIVWGIAPQSVRKSPTEFTRVTLVETKPGPPAVEALEPTGEFKSPQQRDDFSEVKIEHSALSLETVQPAAVREVAEVISVKKRKRSPQRLAEPERKTVTKHEEKKPKKQENTGEILEQRLAALKKDVEAKKKSFSSAASQGKPETATTPGGGGTNGTHVDPELVRWMRHVRGKINAHWAVIGQGPSRKGTVIGVKIADDGALVDTSVDETSGDAAFDKSALRAIHQAAPFPPVPPAVKEKIRQAGGLALRFTPGGIE